MPDTASYAIKMEEIRAIPYKKVKKPYMPMSIYLQEAVDLYHWALDDKDALSQAGLEQDELFDFKKRIEICQEAQTNWNKTKKLKDEHIKKWNEEKDKGIELKTKLLHDFSFAYRNDKAILKVLKGIKKGRSYAHLIQDLSQLSDLGKKYPKELEHIKFDFQKLEIAHEAGSSLGGIYAQAKVTKSNISPSLDYRNQAYTHLKEAVEKLRRYGRFVFKGNLERLNGYSSEYRRRVNNKKQLRSLNDA